MPRKGRSAKARGAGKKVRGIWGYFEGPKIRFDPILSLQASKKMGQAAYLADNV